MGLGANLIQTNKTDVPPVLLKVDLSGLTILSRQLAGSAFKRLETIYLKCGVEFHCRVIFTCLRA